MPEDSDYYQAGADQAAPNSELRTPNSEKPADEKDEDTGAETALLPKSLFGDKEPAVGDVCQFKVEHIWENEIEVSWMAEGEEQKTSKPRTAMDDATSAFDNMAAGQSPTTNP
jgi:hypothetical protein